MSIDPNDYDSPLFLSCACCFVGRTPEAFRLAKRVIELDLINNPFLHDCDPFLAKFRGQPRFDQLMQRVKREWEEFEA